MNLFPIEIFKYFIELNQKVACRLWCFVCFPAFTLSLVVVVLMRFVNCSPRVFVVCTEAIPFGSKMYTST